MKYGYREKQGINFTALNSPEYADLENKEHYDRYLKGLKLKEGDLRGRSILDVGTGSAQFSKYVKDHNISDRILGITKDEGFDIREKTGSTYALAEHMPFADESFDLVVSYGATPNEFVQILQDDLAVIDGKRTITEKAVADLTLVVKRYIAELIRVIKRKNGEIRLGLVFTDKSPLPEQKMLYDIFIKSLEELAEEKGFTAIIENDLCIIKPIQPG